MRGDFMKLKYNAISYVLQTGNSFHKLKLFLILNTQPEEQQKLVKQLRSLQNLDGGWPWQLQDGKPSGTSQTSQTLELLLKAGENTDSNTAKRSVAFLFQMQMEDGGWSENPELREIIPQKWRWMSTQHSGYQKQTLLTP